MSNLKQEELARLRLIAQGKSPDGPVEPPAQLKAGFDIIRKHGLSNRSNPIIRSLYKKFEADADDQVKTSARRLRELFVKEVDRRKRDRDVEEPSEPRQGVAQQAPPTVAAVPTIPVADGFQPDLIDLHAAFGRVAAAYKGQNAFFVHQARADALLKVALGDVQLDNEAVVQIWLAVAYHWKGDLHGGPDRKGSDVLPIEARWILCSICTYLNSRRLGVRTPTIFTPLDDVAFRS